MRSPRSPRPLVASVASLVLLVAVAGCSSGSDDPSASGPSSNRSSTGTAAPDLPPPLEAVWTGPGIDYPELVTSEAAVDIEGSRTVLAIDPATGEELSTFTAPGALKICYVSPQVSQGHLVGLLMRTRGKPCTIAGALDITTGKLLWKQDLPGDPPYHEGRSVAVGDKALLATLNCDEIRRLSLRTGRLLSIIAPGDRKCGHETVTDGTVVAMLDDPETAQTPDDHGTGFIPPSDAKGAFELYDADSGTQLWSHPVATTRGAGVSAVVSPTEPTILTTTEGGHTVTRLWSDDGTPGPALPLSPDDHYGLDVVGSTDDVLVVRYPQSDSPEVLVGYDVSTGSELWRFRPPGDPLRPAEIGLDGDDLVVATATAGGTYLDRYALADPNDEAGQHTLGLATGMPVAVLGDLVVTGDGSAWSGYRVPVDPDAPHIAVPPPAYGPGGDAWEDGDVRPEDISLACTEISSETLLLAGLDWGDLPTPADCHWNESYRPSYLDRSLVVDVTAVQPGQDSTGEPTSATQAAEEYAYGVTGNSYPGKDAPPTTVEPDVVLPMLPEGDALGEQGWGAFADAGADPYEGYPTRLVTRWHNVVIDVSALQNVRIESRMVEAAPPGRLQDAVYAATGEILARLGAEVDLPQPGADGPVSDVVDVCDALRAQGTRLVPGAKPRRQAPVDGQSVCSWLTDNSEVTVLAYAVPGAVDGTSGVDRAAEVETTLPGGTARERRVPGISAPSRYDRYLSKDQSYSSRTLVTRRDNLVVWFYYSAYPKPPEASVLDAALARMVRTVLQANT
ncbi:hypothetical protein BH11ACT8_BH11ACT8_04050 [soil metagenome]